MPACHLDCSTLKLEDQCLRGAAGSVLLILCQSPPRHHQGNLQECHMLGSESLVIAANTSLQVHCCPHLHSLCLFDLGTAQAALWRWNCVSNPIARGPPWQSARVSQAASQWPLSPNLLCNHIAVLMLDSPGPLTFRSRRACTPLSRQAGWPSLHRKCTAQVAFQYTLASFLTAQACPGHQPGSLQKCHGAPQGGWV